jgi:hypothetical protein
MMMHSSDASEKYGSSNDRQDAVSIACMYNGSHLVAMVHSAAVIVGLMDAWMNRWSKPVMEIPRN